MNIIISVPLLLGLVDIFLGIYYLVACARQAIKAFRLKQPAKEIEARIVQALVAPLCLMLAGTILVFSGWRMNSVLTFQQVLIQGVLINFVIRRIRSFQL